MIDVCDDQLTRLDCSVLWGKQVRSCLGCLGGEMTGAFPVSNIHIRGVFLVIPSICFRRRSRSGFRDFVLVVMPSLQPKKALSG